MANTTNNTMTVATVLKAFSTIENNDVTDFDFEAFSSLVDELVEKRKEMKEEKKEAEKAKKEEAKVKNEEVGKAYYLSLAVGDTFQYTTADGTVVTAVKIKTKSGVYNTAACEVICGIETGKSNKRYPKFYQVKVPVPVSFEDETTEDETTEDEVINNESLVNETAENAIVDNETTEDDLFNDEE